MTAEGSYGTSLVSLFSLSGFPLWITSAPKMLITICKSLNFSRTDLLWGHNGSLLIKDNRIPVNKDPAQALAIEIKGSSINFCGWNRNHLSFLLINKIVFPILDCASWTLMLWASKRIPDTARKGSWGLTPMPLSLMPGQRTENLGRDLTLWKVGYLPNSFLKMSFLSCSFPHRGWTLDARQKRLSVFYLNGPSIYGFLFFLRTLPFSLRLTAVFIPEDLLWTVDNFLTACRT